jgi:predicted nucleotidyltransferase component of viral defense system
VKPRQIRNVAASVRQRLLALSRERIEPFDLTLVRYGSERLLYRLSQSHYVDRFLLKGAMLFRVWTEETHRPTRDIDLLGFGANDTDELAQIFREVSQTDVEPDGLVFRPETVKAESIREEAAYAGIRITMEAKLENARIPIQVDIGFGDAVTPGPEEVQYPVLLDLPAPRLRSYPVYTVIAEKLEAMVLLGEANSRMKDFYDAALQIKALSASVPLSLQRRPPLDRIVRECRQLALKSGRCVSARLLRFGLGALGLD